MFVSTCFHLREPGQRNLRSRPLLIEAWVIDIDCLVREKLATQKWFPSHMSSLRDTTEMFAMALEMYKLHAGPQPSVGAIE